MTRRGLLVVRGHHLTDPIARVSGMVEGERNKSNLRILTKVQRLASVGITGALRSTPRAGLEIMLHLLPLDLHLKSVAAKSAIRLRESGFWKQTDFGQGAVLRDFPGIPEATDYVTPRQLLRKDTGPQCMEWPIPTPGRCYFCIYGRI